MYKTSTTTGTKNNKSFEQILIEERTKRGLSLREASAQIGIAHTYLSSLEKGADPRSGKKLIPSPDVVFKICKACDGICQKSRTDARKFSFFIKHIRFGGNTNQSSERIENVDKQKGK